MRRKIYDLIYKDRFSRILCNCDTLLDLGCGKGINSPLKDLSFKRSVGVEIDKEALEINRKSGIHSEYINKSILDIDFEENSFDAVICTDVIEHLFKDEGIEVIKKMERIAKKVIIVSTPNRSMEQDAFDGNPYQHHKSWYDTKFFRDMGFKVYGKRGFKIIPTSYSKKRNVNPVFRKLTKISQFIGYLIPQISTQLLAVKILEK